jgi:UDP-N-acetylmuramoyl-tripeptide--D-alanyl-D-alanine ligase
MRELTLQEFALAAGGTLYGSDAKVLRVTFDSRDVRAGDLYVAVRGANVDGHVFCESALASGAVACLVERAIDGPRILVADVVQALARFGATFRDQFQGQVVGVTGSAGKTTTKELIAAALSPLGPIIKTEGNRNSEFTSPLVWVEGPADAKAAVIEMGMRGFGQIAHLASFQKPTIGVIVNIGWSHIEMVGNRDGIATAKGELFEALPADGVAILNAEEDENYTEVLAGKFAGRKRTFGLAGSGADLEIEDYQPLSWSECAFVAKLGDERHPVRLGFVGSALARNAAAALLVSVECGVPFADACRAIQTVKLPPMRMEVREFNGATVILDAYNAAPNSVISALESFRALCPTGRRVAILGEMRELGIDEERGHRIVGKALVEAGIDRAITLGEPTKWIVDEAKAHGMADIRQAGDIDEVKAFLRTVSPGDTVLIKGSRAVALERALEP